MSDLKTSRPQRKLGNSTETKSAPKKAAAKSKKKDSKSEVYKLEYEIVGKIATLNIADKTIKFKKWGLAKRLQLGARVSMIFDQVKPFLVGESDDVSPRLVVSLLGSMASDIMFVIIESTQDTFLTHDEGIDWLDDNCGPEEIFALGKILYDMNLQDAEQMGKLTKGMDNLASSLANLLKE